jgi:hypothetical protein
VQGLRWGRRAGIVARAQAAICGNYYGAFVLDADGSNIEAVCHRAA